MSSILTIATVPKLSVWFVMLSVVEGNCAIQEALCWAVIRRMHRWVPKWSRLSVPKAIGIQSHHVAARASESHHHYAPATASGTKTNDLCAHTRQRQR